MNELNELKEYVLNKTSTINRNIVETLSEESEEEESDFSSAKMTVTSDSENFSATLPLIGNSGITIIGQSFKANDEVELPLYKNKLSVASNWEDFKVDGDASISEHNTDLIITGDFTITYKVYL